MMAAVKRCQCDGVETLAMAGSAFGASTKRPVAAAGRPAKLLIERHMDWDRARHTFQTALIWITAAALVFVLWWIRDALLLAFGAIMVAIMLRVLADIISGWTRIPKRTSLVIAAGLVVALIGVTVWLFGSHMSGQFNQLLHNIQRGEQYFEKMLRDSGFAGLQSQVSERGTTFLTSTIKEIVSGGLRVAQAAVIIGITGVYLAAQPQLYRHGVALLFRRDLRPRVTETIDLIGRTLKLWVLGQLILMIGVGLLSFVALLLIGVPNPAALALLAGIAEMVPYIGPFLSAIPAVLVALTLGLMPAVWTMVAYLAIHIFEGYITAPLIQRYFVTIPPALILIGIVAVDLLFGAIGIVLAAPLTVAIYMAVKMAYVEDPLEEDEPSAHHSA
jgi:predicted PurR-regulated permease PerM